MGKKYRKACTKTAVISYDFVAIPPAAKVYAITFLVTYSVTLADGDDELIHSEPLQARQSLPLHVLCSPVVPWWLPLQPVAGRGLSGAGGGRPDLAHDGRVAVLRTLLLQ